MNIFLHSCKYWNYPKIYIFHKIFESIETFAESIWKVMKSAMLNLINCVSRKLHFYKSANFLMDIKLPGNTFHRNNYLPFLIFRQRFLRRVQQIVAVCLYVALLSPRPPSGNRFRSKVCLNVYFPNTNVNLVFIWGVGWVS